MRRLQSGFTIVELLIVVVVIAILAAITIVGYNGIQNQAKSSAAQSAASQGYKKIASYAIQNADQYPANLSSAGLANSGDTNYQYRVDNTSNPKIFCLTTTANNTSYFVSQANGSPLPGACAGHGGTEISNLFINPQPTSSTLWIPARMTRTFGGTGNSSYVEGTRNDSSGSSYFNTTHAVNRVAVQPGQVVSISADVETFSTNAQPRMRILFLDASGVAIPGWGDGTPYLGAGTSRISHTSTAPANAAFFGAYLLMGGSFAMDEKVRFSNYMANLGTNTKYFDGDSPGWVWTGAKNNSTSVGPSL